MKKITNSILPQCILQSTEVRDWAIHILSATTLENKLLTPQTLTDHRPGPPMIWNEPSRPSHLQFQTTRKPHKLPPFHAHHHPDHRAECLHRFAGHELLAVEIMAYALLKFPYAPYAFRKGVIHTLKEEQHHVRLYLKQLERLGVCFGDLPLYKHFWVHTQYLDSPIHYVSVMNLTFEMANLDFAPMYGKSFEQHGDIESANLMKKILADEINHVAFGWRWLDIFKDPQSSHWDAWSSAQSPLLTPKRARGFVIHESHRKAAGVSKEWIHNLQSL